MTRTTFMPSAYHFQAMLPGHIEAVPWLLKPLRWGTGQPNRRLQSRDTEICTHTISYSCVGAYWMCSYFFGTLWFVCVRICLDVRKDVYSVHRWFICTWIVSFRFAGAYCCIRISTIMCAHNNFKVFVPRRKKQQLDAELDFIHGIQGPCVYRGLAIVS